MVSDVLTLQLLEYNVEMGRFFKRGCKFDTTNASSIFSFLVMFPKYVLGHVGRNNIKINPVLFIVPRQKYVSETRQASKVNGSTAETSYHIRT